MECFALAPKLVGKHVTTTGQKGKGCQRPKTSVIISNRNKNYDMCIKLDGVGPVENRPSND